MKDFAWGGDLATAYKPEKVGKERPDADAPNPHDVVRLAVVLLIGGSLMLAALVGGSWWLITHP